MENKKLPGLSKYLIRSDGEIVSTWGKESRVLSGGLDKDGYRKFVLIDDMGARRYVRRASLVCAAFHGPRHKGKEVRHLDGTRINDVPANLAWGTHKENCADKIGHMTRQRGVASGNCTISEAQALQIKDMISKGIVVAEIAKEIGVRKTLINNIKYGNTWAWL